MDVESYLQRLNYSGTKSVSVETLHALQEAHMMAAPFENLDIHLHRPIILEEERLLDKVVVDRRGGFCYELNGAFAWLLHNLGFDVTYLSAGVLGFSNEFGPDFDHMALFVPVGGVRWLVDVGFGDSTRQPLSLDTNTIQNDGFCRFQLVEEGDYIVLKRQELEGDWRPQYRFTMQPRTLPEYNDMCRFHQTSPESPFTQRIICSQATPDGRMTLMKDRFIHTTPAGPQEKPVANAAEFEALLAKWYGIQLLQPFAF